jgi:hypothetical protein
MKQSTHKTVDGNIMARLKKKLYALTLVLLVLCVPLSLSSIRIRAISFLLSLPRSSVGSWSFSNCFFKFYHSFIFICCFVIVQTGMHFIP